MRYNISQTLISEFSKIAVNNLALKGGLIVETLAYLAGYEEHNELYGTHLIFPSQRGTSSYVEDFGKLMV